MTKHASNRAQMNSISQGAYNATSPFSAGLFTNRRVWVKKVDGSPTTILVHQNDIIDDLKQAVMLKFPNSLAKQYDPADFTIKMDLSARRAINSTGMNNLAKKQAPKQKSNSPDPSKANLSPVSTSTSFSFINLEPDKNVWSILDTYYPKGMTMSEAFLIDVPRIDHSSLPNSNNGSVSSTHGNFSSTRSFQNTLQTGYSNLQQPQPQKSGATTYNQNQPPHKSQRFSSYAIPSGSHIEKSISPSTVHSPSHAGNNWHRRSYSNNIQSSNVNANAQDNGNSQAVLLLPRNFSLATGGSSSIAHDKKRLSLDDGQQRKETHEQQILSPHIQEANMNNVDTVLNESSAHSSPFPIPFDKQNATLHKLDIPGGSLTETLTDPSNDSISTITEMSGTSKALPITNNLSLKNDKMHGEVPDLHESQRKSIDTESVSILPSPIQADNLNTGIPNDKHTDIIRSVDSINRNEKFEREYVDTKKLNPRKNGADNESKTIKSSRTTIEKVLPSISVLVVEDNAINQAILGAFLRKHKIHYKIAKNGQEAIDNWRQGGFHLVLMDIQLPVKSGIDATKEIRHLEKVNEIGVFAENEINYGKAEVLRSSDRLDINLFRSPVIIVALTASSNSSIDRQNALMAGCNDYLTKPVNLVWLQNKITEWGCMQALIDFDGWSKKKPSNGDHERSRWNVFK